MRQEVDSLRLECRKQRQQMSMAAAAFGRISSAHDHLSEKMKHACEALAGMYRGDPLLDDDYPIGGDDPNLDRRSNT